MLNRPELSKRRIGIIEANHKVVEKTWSFWEKGGGQWDQLLHFHWKKGSFIDHQRAIDLKMEPYAYKMVRSEDFVGHFKKIILSSDHLEWIEDQIIEVDELNATAHSKERSYHAQHIFDSRFDPNELKRHEGPGVLQHFKGWFIETEDAVFDPETFVMMDYRLAYPDQCAFTYILPLSERKALVEYTFFSPKVLSSDEYDALLQKYISQYIGTNNYQITGNEAGVIPMSSYRFDQFNTEKYTRIGTAGGWVKASTGYSFKHAEKKSKKIADNLARGRLASKGTGNGRFRLYDKIFLSLLENENQLGNDIFIQMYRKNSSKLIFRFLDEETNPFEELYLISRFRHAPFLRAVGREFF